MTPPLSEHQEKFLRQYYYDGKRFYGRDKLFQTVYTQFPEQKINEVERE